MINSIKYQVLGIKLLIMAAVFAFGLIFFTSSAVAQCVDQPIANCESNPEYCYCLGCLQQSGCAFIHYEPGGWQCKTATNVCSGNAVEYVPPGANCGSTTQCSAQPVALSGSISLNSSSVEYGGTISGTVSANSVAWRVSFCNDPTRSNCSATSNNWTTLGSGTGNGNFSYSPVNALGTYTVGLLDPNSNAVVNTTVVTISSVTPTVPPSSGLPEGSSCKYTILDTTGTDVTRGPIYPSEPYRVRVEMTNAGSGETSTWIAGSYGLRLESTPVEFWGGSQSIALTTDRIKGQTAVFETEIISPALKSQTFDYDSYQLKMVMVNSNAAEFGAECNPLNVQVHKKPLGPTSTQCYAISENEEDVRISSCDFTNPDIHPYTDNPINIELSAGAGEKNVYVMFLDNNGRQSNNGIPYVKTVVFSPDPEITNVTCSVAQNGTGTQAIITGSNFGTAQGQGKVSIGNQEAQVVWGTNTIAALVRERFETNIPVTVVVDDGRTVTKRCSINTTTVDFTAVGQCKVAGSSLDDVDVRIFQYIPNQNPNQPFFRTQATFDKDHSPTGFAPKLEVGRSYSLVVKGKDTLSKRVDFTALQGTTVIPNRLVLPVGDIDPRDNPNGVINNGDLSELKGQWNLLKDLDRSADLNSDGRVNSLDYSCILQNFNKRDEVFSPPVVPTPTPTITPTPTSTPTPGT